MARLTLLLLAVLLLAAPLVSAVRMRSKQQVMTPLDRLKTAARQIEKRFRTEQTDAAFGRGLDKKMVKEVVNDSEDFWSEISSLSESDVAELSDSDAEEVKEAVKQVAQLDDDLDDAKRHGQVKREFERLEEEFAEEGV
eukprot:PLAT15826.1.p3 GENE.PLAT15826.1~~PLAT15826.1.p3  ORF type:complete len:157 (-),score=66.34 PLAT15826.1:118-534(-)